MNVVFKNIIKSERIKRGLYETKDNIIINADLNGSANIITKVFDNKIKDLNLIMSRSINFMFYCEYFLLISSILQISFHLTSREYR